jgi:hypothetical protein
LRAREGRTVVKISLGKKLATLYLKNKLLWWYISVIPAMGKGEVRGLWSEASPSPKHKSLYIYIYI